MIYIIRTKCQWYSLLIFGSIIQNTLCFILNQSEKNLANCRLFHGKYAWIKTKASDNGAMLAMYFNTYLRNTVGKKREEWKVTDFDIAFEKLMIAEEFVEKVLSEYLHLDNDV